MLADQLADQPERRAWHLAEAAIGPDEQIAILLEDTACRVLQRGDAAGAVAALLRAADLSPAGPGRGRRLAQAAYLGAGVTGELGNVRDLLAEARRADPELSGSLYGAVAAAFLLLNEGGSVDNAHHLLVGAIEAHADSGDASDAALIEALLALLLLCSFGGRLELWKPFRAAIARLRPRPPADLYLVSQTNADPARLTAAVLTQIDTAVAEMREEVDYWRILKVSSAALYTDRLAGCREPLWRVIRAGREGGGAVTPAITALGQLFIDDWMTGRWDEAQQLADEASELCAAGDYPLQAWMVRHRQAMLAAARGDEDSARRLTEEMTRWAAPRGVGMAVAAAHHVGSIAALGRGDYEDAYQHAAAISPPGVFARGVPFALWVPMDLIEAAVRTGRQAEGAAHVTAMRETGVAAISPRLALVTAGSAAIAAPDHQAAALFEEALGIAGAQHWPFDRARIQLAHGERLRRIRVGADARSQLTDARSQLTAALDTFQRLGARPWAARAGNELRAAGRPGDIGGASSLSAPEHEIAMLAASGLSNKEIGERLFLSHRTVGAHLYQIFPKLGITSRAALRDALAELAADDPAVGGCSSPAGDGGPR